MAISEDTAALVAAQLTVAWATRMARRDIDTRTPLTEQIKEIYLRFKAEVAEMDLPGPS